MRNTELEEKRAPGCRCKQGLSPVAMFCLHASGQGVPKATLLAMTTVVLAVQVPELSGERHTSKDQIYKEHVVWVCRGKLGAVYRSGHPCKFVSCRTADTFSPLVYPAPSPGPTPALWMLAHLIKSTWKGPKRSLPLC